MLTRPMPRVTKMIGGKEVEIPVEDVWPAIARVVRLARLATCEGTPEHQAARLSFLKERLHDLFGLTLNGEE